MSSKPESKSLRILDLIESSGQAGMMFTDIQFELWSMSNDPDKWSRQLRGYWCTALLGGMHYHAGLLRFYCTKGPDGLWRRNKKAHLGKPWKTMEALKPSHATKMRAWYAARPQ